MIGTRGNHLAQGLAPPNGLWRPVTPWWLHAILLCPRGRETPGAGAARTPGVAGRLWTQRQFSLPHSTANTENTATKYENYTPIPRPQR